MTPALNSFMSIRYLLIVVFKSEDQRRHNNRLEILITVNCARFSGTHSTAFFCAAQRALTAAATLARPSRLKFRFLFLFSIPIGRPGLPPGSLLSLAPLLCAHLRGHLANDDL
jgi:hypothetical protein